MEITIKTTSRSEMIDITDDIQNAISSECNAVLIYCPHTTCGITINEGHDPDVKHDILEKLDRLFPNDEHFFRHAEGNSDSHLKAAVMGASAMVPVEKGALNLGTWQRIFLCEFDGPRSRTIYITLV
jgi:secondary thiamine-phosphate synthase enzyme